MLTKSLSSRDRNSGSLHLILVHGDPPSFSESFSVHEIVLFRLQRRKKVEYDKHDKMLVRIFQNISRKSTLRSFVGITSQLPRFCLPVLTPEVRTHYPQISTRASGSENKKHRVQATARKLCRRTSRISAKFMCSNHTVHPNYNHTHARVNSRSRFEVSVRVFRPRLG